MPLEWKTWTSVMVIVAKLASIIAISNRPQKQSVSKDINHAED